MQIVQFVINMMKLIGVEKVFFNQHRNTFFEILLFSGRSLRHISCKNLKSWVVFYPSSLRELGDELINALYQVCVPFGMEVEYPNV
jgi:hypothetical protein